MQDSDDLDHLLMDTIHSQVGKAGKHQFTRVRPAAWASTPQKPRRQTHAFVDSKRHAPRRRRALMFLDLIANVGKIPSSRLGPTNTDQPG
jgi:hypothetical protein